MIVYKYSVYWRFAKKDLILSEQDRGIHVRYVEQSQQYLSAISFNLRFFLRFVSTRKLETCM